MVCIRRVFLVFFIAILSVGLAGGTLPCVMFDDLVRVDPLFRAIPSFTLPDYDGAIFGHAPSLEVLSPRAPPLA